MRYINTLAFTFTFTFTPNLLLLISGVEARLAQLEPATADWLSSAVDFGTVFAETPMEIPSTSILV